MCWEFTSETACMGAEAILNISGKGLDRQHWYLDIFREHGVWYGIVWDRRGFCYTENGNYFKIGEIIR